MSPALICCDVPEARCRAMRERVAASALRLRRGAVFARAAVAHLGHELVELGLVLGLAQPVEKLAELALLLFEPAQCLIAVFVKGAVAAAAHPIPALPGARAAPPLGLL